MPHPLGPHAAAELESEAILLFLPVPFLPPPSVRPPAEESPAGVESDEATAASGFRLSLM